MRKRVSASNRDREGKEIVRDRDGRERGGGGSLRERERER